MKGIQSYLYNILIKKNTNQCDWKLFPANSNNIMLNIFLPGRNSNTKSKKDESLCDLKLKGNNPEGYG